MGSIPSTQGLRRYLVAEIELSFFHTFRYLLTHPKSEIMKTIRKMCLLAVAISIIPFLLHAITMKEALDEAAEYFVKTAVRIDPGQELHVLEVTNYSSGEHDMEGKRLETELYFALERQFPDFKLFLGKGQTPEKEIYMAGTYEQKAGKTTVKLRVFQGNEILAQYEVQFDSKVHRKALVAVLDLEAETLNDVQRKAFSDIFRSALGKSKKFEMASSADIDKMNPDDIQNATGCTRDSCATIIGEQLGVDRVISSSFMKVSEEMYIISAKMIDIKDGSILITETVEHNGSLGTLKDSLTFLARKLTGDEDELITREEEVVSESSNLVWHITALTLAIGSAAASISSASSYNELAQKNTDLEQEYASTYSSVEIQRIQTEYDENKLQMEAAKTSVSTFDALTALALLWETYLIVFGGPDEPEEDASRLAPDRIIVQPRLANAPNPTAGVKLSWDW